MKRGRPSLLSRDAILDIAQEIDEKDLSFSGVAEALGVAPTSLYHYFGNLEELRTAITQRLIEKVEFLDNHPPGDFCSYLIRFLLDYRDWLEELSLDPSLFKIDFGALSFTDDSPPEPLYVRLENFMTTADAEGVDLETAISIWFVITDFMSRSLSICLPERYLAGIQKEMKIFLKVRDADEFPLIRSYLEGYSQKAVPSRSLYETSVRVLVKGLAQEFNLDGDPRTRNESEWRNFMSGGKPTA